MSVVFPLIVSLLPTRSDVSLLTRWSMAAGCRVRKMTVIIKLKGRAM